MRLFSRDLPPFRLRSPEIFAGLTLAWIIASVVGLGARELWNPMEPRYAGIVRAMEGADQIWVPRYEGRFYDQKPPLYFWAARLATGLFGNESRFALRLPSALGALIAAFATALLARRLYGRRVALWAGLVLLTSYSLFWSSRFANLDTLTAAATALSALGLLEAFRRRGNPKQALLFGASGLWLGIMTKGPLVPAVFILATLLMLLRSRRGHRRPALLSGLALLVAGLFFASWVSIAVAEAGLEWAKALLVGQGLERPFAAKNQEDRNGPFYYCAAIFGAVAPWSLVFLSLLWSHVKERRQFRRHAFVWSFLAIILLLLSAHGVRRERYLIPALPFAAILIGYQLERLRHGALKAEFLSRLHSGLATASAVVLGVVSLWPDALRSLLKPSERNARALAHLGDNPLRFIAAFFAVFVVALSLWSLRRSDFAASMRSLLAAALFSSAAFGLLVTPAIDAARGDPELIALLRAESHRQPVTLLGPYAYRESTHGWFHWYTERSPDQVAEAPRDWRSLERQDPSLLILQMALADSLREHWPKDWKILTERPIGRAGLCVVRMSAAP